jgi:hypothetical protein
MDQLILYPALEFVVIVPGTQSPDLREDALAIRSSLIFRIIGTDSSVIFMIECVG